MSKQIYKKNIKYTIIIIPSVRIDIQQNWSDASDSFFYVFVFLRIILYLYDMVLFLQHEEFK